MSPHDAAQDLREILGTPKSITVGGKPLSVRGLRFEELPIVIELFTPVAQDSLGQVVDVGLWLSESGIVREGERVRLDSAMLIKILVRCVPLMSTLPSGLRAAQKVAALCADQPEEWVGKLDVGEALRLIECVLEVNADFFSRSVLPLFTNWLSIRRPAKSPVATSPNAPSPPAASPTPSSS